MKNILWLLLLPLLLFSKADAMEEGEHGEPSDGILLEELLRQMDNLPTDKFEQGSIVLADAGDADLVISLPGGGEVISSDELSFDGPENLLEDPDDFLINFNNLNIVEVIRFVSRISGKNFIFDEEELDFTVTIVSEEPTSVQNVMAALLQVLKIHDLQLIEQGNNFLIHKNPNVQRPSRIVADGADEDDERDATTLVTRVFRLERVPAASLSIIIRSMTSADALVQTLDETNHLVITDLASNVSRVASFIRAIDGPGGQLDVGQYVVRNTHMVALIQLSDKILKSIAQNDPLELIEHKPTDSIFIISTPYMVERAMSILQMLDLTDNESRIMSLKDLVYDPEMDSDMAIPTDDKRWADALPSNDIQNTGFEFYKLQYRTADTIQSALEQIGESISTTVNFNPDILSAIDSVQAIEESNMLVFTGTTAAIAFVKDFISKIDVPLRQVFIEMLLLDTSIDKSLEFGVDWGAGYSGGANGAGTIGFLGPSSPVPSALDSLGTGTATISNATEGFSAGALGKVLTHNGNAFTSLSGFIKAVQTDSDVNVVMNPKIIAEDNTPAEVFVGINTRFKTESVANESGDLVTTNFEFRDVGSRLRVTPLLGNSNIITLIIEQDLSSGLGDVSTTSATDEELGPVTKQIQTTTRVHIPDKQFLVMSGMITEERTRGKTSVPCLGGLPVAGSAFARNKYRSNKRNLMIFIRPQIVDTEQEIARLTKNQRDLFKNKSRKRKKWEFEVESGLDILNLKRAKVTEDLWEP